MLLAGVVDWQLLEELCHKNSWPLPQYQLHSAVHHDVANNTAINIQLFIFKVRSFSSQTDSGTCPDFHLGYKFN